MKALVRLTLAGILAACGGSDSAGTSSGDPVNDGGANVPVVPGVPDGTFQLTIDDPGTVRSIIQTQSTELTLHIKRGSGIGPISITVTGLPKDALAAPLSLDGNTNDATLKIVTAATTPQGPATLAVVAKATTTSAPDATVDIQAFVRGAPGALDTTWADGGIIARPYPTNTGDGKGVIVLPDGSSLWSVPLVKVTPKGEIDKTFGNQGFAVDSARDPLVIDAMGRLYSLRESVGSTNGGIVRTLPNGQLDSSFASNALLAFGYSTTVDMVVAGTKIRVVDVGGGSGVSKVPFSIIQLNEDGSQDASWGSSAFPASIPPTCISETSFGYPVVAVAVSNGQISVDAAGNTHVVGTAHDSTTHKAFLLTCSPDGKTATTHLLDTTGSVIDSVPIPGGGFLVLVQTPGVGNTSNGYWARFDAAGVHDTTFGEQGFVNSQIEAASRIALQPDGKILVGGTTGAAGSSDITLTRFEANGSLDPTFGTAGHVVTRVGNGTNDSRCGKLAFGPDGRIYVAGSHFDEPNASFIRYWN